MTQNKAAETSTALRLTGDFVCDILKVILENEEKYQKFIKEIIQAKEIIKTTSNDQLKLKENILTSINDYNSFYTEENYNKLKIKFTCEERSILQFHHLDPSQKEFALSDINFNALSFNMKMLKEEVNKCQLLCANCHAEQHFLSELP